MQLNSKTFNGTVGAGFSTLNIGGTLVSTGRYPIESWRVWDTVEDAKAFVMYNGNDATAFEGMILSIKSGDGKGVYVLNKVGDAAKTNGEFDETAWTKLLDNKSNGQYLKSVEYIDSSNSDYADSDADLNDVGLLKFVFITDGGEEEVITYDLNAALSQATINSILQNCAVQNGYTTTVKVGNIAAGTQIAQGTTIEELLKRILCQEMWASGTTAPSLTCTFKANLNDGGTATTGLSGKTLEIGTKITNINYDTFQFNQGKIKSYSGTTETNIDSGCTNTGNPDLSETVTLPYYVVNGQQTLTKASIAYSASTAVAQSNLGTPATGDNASHNNTIAAGTTPKVSCTVTGRYKVWVGTLPYQTLNASSTASDIITAFGNTSDWLDANGNYSKGTVEADGSSQIYAFFPSTHELYGTQMNSSVNPVDLNTAIDYTLPDGTTVSYTLATWGSVSQTYNNVAINKK